MIRRALSVAFASAVALAAPALAIDAAHAKKAQQMIEKAQSYLRSKQDEATGGWALNKEGPQYPAITALVVRGLLLSPEAKQDDPAVQKGAAFILKHRQPDGGIYDRVLASYNTSICLSALALVKSPEADAAIKPAQDFLRSIQWSEGMNESADSPKESGEFGKVTKDHPFYGGVGYGRHGRPDNSNLQFMLEGLHDSGLDCNDPAFQRALVFLARTQMDDRVNDQPYAKGSRQGGFVYATSENKERVGQGQSQTGTIEERLADGTTGSRLRAYGSMTYAGFKSYIYAELDRADQRVVSAYDWIRKNYTLDENPGAGKQGLFYYYMAFARALDAWGDPTVKTLNADGAPGAERDWANDLVDQLEKLQKEDGSWVNDADRWMEGEPVLVTAYAVIALQHAID